METLAQMLAAVTAENPRRTAIVEGETAVSYTELSHSVLSLAGQLYRMGIRSGDRVAVLLPNGLNFVVSYFAVAALGAIVVPLNEQYQDGELRRFLAETKASLLITSRPTHDTCQRVLSAYEDACQLLLIEDCAQSSIEGGRFPDLAVVEPTAPVMYQFSSGSTGRPKRIARTHRNLIVELKSLVQTLGITSEDRFIGVTPFSHVNGLMRSMMTSLFAGATLYPVARFDRHAAVEMIENHRISVFIGVPFMFGIMARTNYGRSPDFSRLRVCVSASAPMPAELNRQFHEKFGMYVRQLYGSSETGTISVNMRADVGDSLESVGKPTAGVEVEICSDDGEVLRVNEVGEIAVESGAATQSYGCEELDSGTFRNGYFLTGDLGRKDHDDLLYLVGRKKLFINKGGYKINPREVEELLESHPKIEEAVVIGVATPFGDQKVKAVLVTNAPCSEVEIIDHCRGKIAEFKVPSIIEVRDEFPKSPTGKVRRELLT
jgi:long-chain acyl-CoA synthetase